MDYFVPGCSLDALDGIALGWPASGLSVYYCLPGVDQFDPQDVNNTLSQLLNARAVPDPRDVIAADGATEPWITLVAAEYVQETTVTRTGVSEGKVGFALTPRALRCIRVGASYPESVPLFQVRQHLALPELTTFELARMLVNNGWVWRLFPKNIIDRLALTHSTSENVGSWFTLGRTLVRPYLLCLLNAQQLRERYAISDIPHYSMKPIKDFGELLNGKPFVSTVCAEPKPKRMLPLQDEFPPDEVEVQPLALQDDFGDAAVEDVADGDGSDLETMLARYIEEELEQEEQAADLEHSDDEQESDAPAPGVPDEPDGPVDELDGPAGEPDQFVESGDVPMEAGSRQKLRTIPWGPQSIARKKNKRGKEVAFECRCGFHKLNAGTVCKNTISYNAGSEEHAFRREVFSQPRGLASNPK